LWTDSAITYTWINNHPSRWKEFVQNRVCFIQETLPQAIWCSVPGKENSADITTRGLSLAQLIEMSTWWTGPYWLSQHPSTFPNEPRLLTSNDNLEEKLVQVSTVSAARTAEKITTTTAPATPDEKGKGFTTFTHAFTASC